MTSAGCRKHGRTKPKQMSHLPNGGDLLIERGGIGMRMQNLGAGFQIATQYGLRLLDAVRIAAHGDRFFHNGSQIGHKLVWVI